MKVECNLEDVFEVTKRKLEEGGLLLTTVGRDRRYNVMTIGWGLVGRLWREQVFMVAVRPSRYTFTFIEETDTFTVNVPAEGMEKVTAYCGEVSGRDHDKLTELELAVSEGRRVTAPIIDRCIAHFECEVIGKSKLIPELLSPIVQKRHFSSEDYHTLYFGRLLSILKDR